MRQALLSLLRLLLFVQGSHRPHGFQVFLIFYLRIQDQTDHLMKYSSFVLEICLQMLRLFPLKFCLPKKLVLHFEKCRFCIFLMRSWKYSGIAANAAMPAIVFSFAIYPFTEPPVIPST